tara:strand:+ start:2034 stop:2336 length:303 start_codon:yes stop_codon:yes gene_type:complete
MSESRKIVSIYKDVDFEVVKEEVPEACFFHCYVTNFNKTVLKRMREVWESIKREAYAEGWPQIHSYTPNPKFAMLLPGAKKVNEFEAEGQHFEVIRWELE